MKFLVKYFSNYTLSFYSIICLKYVFFLLQHSLLSGWPLCITTREGILRHETSRWTSSEPSLPIFKWVAFTILFFLLCLLVLVNALLYLLSLLHFFPSKEKYRASFLAISLHHHAAVQFFFFLSYFILFLAFNYKFFIFNTGRDFLWLMSLLCIFLLHPPFCKVKGMKNYTVMKNRNLNSSFYFPIFGF